MQDAYLNCWRRQMDLEFRSLQFLNSPRAHPELVLNSPELAVNSPGRFAFAAAVVVVAVGFVENVALITIFQ